MLADRAPARLDLPASISFGAGATEGTLYAVNLANVEAFSTGFGPALVAIDVDLPRKLGTGTIWTPALNVVPVPALVTGGVAASG